MPAKDLKSRKVKVFVKHDAHKKLKLLAVEKGITMGDLVEIAIPYLEKMPELLDKKALERKKE